MRACGVDRAPADGCRPKEEVQCAGGDPEARPNKYGAGGKGRWSARLSFDAMSMTGCHTHSDVRRRLSTTHAGVSQEQQHQQDCGPVPVQRLTQRCWLNCWARARRRSELAFLWVAQPQVGL